MPRRCITKQVVSPSRQLTNAVTGRFLADFKKYGIAAIERLREENPAKYVECVVRLAPQQVELEIGPQFKDILEQAAKQIQARQAGQIKLEDVIEGEIEQSDL